MPAKKKIEVEVTHSEDETQTSGNKASEDDPQETAAADVETEATGEVAEEEELREEEKLRRQVAELEDRHLRAVAEFENYKKRTARQFEGMFRSANDKILIELLDVVDSFERALQHKDGNSDVGALSEGMELIYNQMTTLLARYDVQPIEAVGKPFDPNLHEALMQVASDEYPEGTVTIEIGKGYELAGRVIRHSKVGVSKGAAKEGTADTEESES
ncbi:MAG: nucleotide exchange factor GrpE [candidate division Zixibacteria bacterium]|nr:nucleotide exchange factor GrpE [candidate division Zixibacteria bacterium]